MYEIQDWRPHVITGSPRTRGLHSPVLRPLDRVLRRVLESCKDDNTPILFLRIDSFVHKSQVTLIDGTPSYFVPSRSSTGPTCFFESNYFSVILCVDFHRSISRKVYRPRSNNVILLFRPRFRDPVLARSTQTPPVGRQH